MDVLEKLKSDRASLKLQVESLKNNFHMASGALQIVEKYIESLESKEEVKQ